MSDSTTPTNNSAPSTGRTQGSTSKDSAPKLNPDAKDYVPRSVTSENPDPNTPRTAAADSQASSSNSNNRSRRRRNNESRKPTGDSSKEGDNPTGSTSHNSGNQGNGGNRNRNRNRGRVSKPARIDDDDDDIEINLDRPLELSEPSEPSGAINSLPTTESTSTSASTSIASKDRRNDRSRKGKDANKDANKDASKDTSSSSTPKPQQGRNDKKKSRAGTSNGQLENASSSSSSRAPTGANGNNTTGSSSRGENRRQRNRKTGDLAGRTFPTTPQGSSNQTGESSGSQRNPQRKAPRNQPRKFVHKIEEDRDLMGKLTEGLTNSTYECMVCWDVVRPAHKIWNCQVCWAAFHLDCLSTWAKKSSEDANNNGSGWRCPGCQNTQISIPKEYVCFCGKANSPDFNRYLTPHSCGELCGRPRDCPHPCNIPCHPGPCPPCGGLGPIQSCHCGSESFQLRCVETDFSFQTGKSCNTVCGELLGCGKHTCTSVCHAGLCPPCFEAQEQKCYCGRHTREASCGDGVPKISIVDGEEQTGYYECYETCGRLLACGHHECQKPCHSLDIEPGQCPARPEVVKTCPCGSKTIEALLLGKSRSSCTDPIPVCGGVCKKQLSCGHRCMQKCHKGDCPPCRMSVTVDCRCGSSRVQRVCSDMGTHGDELPTCDRLCRGLRACGKHECTNRCCPGKNKTKGKKSDLAAQEAHICPLVCGKKLQCGVHSCEMLCHKGHCNPCMIAKPCMCRKSKMPNVPCYKSNPSCGKTCGKRLDCNLHNCIKSCHSGECSLPPLDICSQSCPKARKSCGHKCGLICHGDTPCPEDQPCRVIVPSTCKCGNLTMESACNSTAENPWDGKPRIFKCNDYCLIAERNKRVALALEIDESANQPGPRIPDYEPYVLDYALAHMEFTLKIEKQLAEWIADTAKPMLNFPPMKGHRRKFVHELAANYDTISESVDVEPYRSVTIRRLANTSVPDLLASQACRQKRLPSTNSTTPTIEQLRKPAIKDPINAIYLHELAFGLTRSELAAQLAPVFGNIKYGIRWLTDDDAVLVPHPGSMQMDELEVVLVRLRAGIKVVVAKGNICERVELCWVNKEGEVVSHTNVGGGSQTKKFFNASQGNQWLKKSTAVPAKVANAFALLDDDERIAAAKREEEEIILKAKEAAGTLSTDAWEEEAETSSSSAVALAHQSLGRSSLSQTASVAKPSTEAEDLTKFVVVEAGEFTNEVVDDWQELLEDDSDEITETKTTAENDIVLVSENNSQDTAPAKSPREKSSEEGLSSKGDNDDETVVINQSDLTATDIQTNQILD
ncbi:FKBP12-associated protein [Entomortierella beljakovae]|nr:FKBP12-associated protein [Entomortierella beljakovae]